jgi:hypothetical protein
MNESIEAITRSVLYEGYLLWPYRRSALKNQRRWTFGGVYPRAYSESGHADDAWLMRTECLAELGQNAALDVSVRFLQVVDRRIACQVDGGLRFVDGITVAGVRHVAWQEAVEREVRLPTIRPRDLPHGSPVRLPIRIDAGEMHEPLAEDGGAVVGAIVRGWKAIAGSVEVGAECLARSAWKVRVDVSNGSTWNGEKRETVLERTLISTHVVLQARDAEFVSLTDPPPRVAGLAAACTNIGTWPVLAGSAPARDTVLSSPFILPDYPEVAPQSRGDFFDGGEIDQLLVLSVLAMTDEEQRQMRESDPRGRDILARCQSLSPDDIRRLHGTTRELQPEETGV